MRIVRALAASLALVPAMALAQPVLLPPGADIFVLGEIHDNPAHHAEQARLVAAIGPGAIVWEMLLPAQIAGAATVDRADAAELGRALGWAEAGWPDFAMYHPIFLAGGDALHIGGAVARDGLRRAMSDGALAAYGPPGPHFDAAVALAPLPEADRLAREAEQAQAHCGALPETMLPGMVEAQRLRDAMMSSVALRALDEGHGPIVIITGTGHARADVGIPAMIRAARPDVAVWTLGQLESDPGDAAPFDAVNVTAAASRGDPCAAFR